MMGKFRDLTHGDEHEVGRMKHSMIEQESWMDSFSHLTDMHIKKMSHILIQS
jgi:hypothetical protein